MSERRVDPFTGRAVWIAPSRAGLGATRSGGLPTPRGRCPFCPGHEADAEPTVAQWPPAGPWQVRVVRNKYPLVGPPRGDHEVGVDARGHDVDLGDLTPSHAAGMLRLYRARYRALAARPGTAAVLFFRNRGRRAGSSQPHPHSQLVALPEVPTSLRQRAARSNPELHAEERERARVAGRVVMERAAALALCPFAPSRAHQVRLAPSEEAGGFEDASDAVIADIAALLVGLIGRLTGQLGVLAYNLALRSLPDGAASWSLDVLPRTGGDAGFELLSEEPIVVVPPERTAARLRGE